MNIYRHIPCRPLNQYIDWLWYYVDLQFDHDREHVLPDGTFELIINLEDRPRKLFAHGNSPRNISFRRGWFSGTQTKYLIIDVPRGSSMIGAHFKPGGVAAFLGMPAGELCEQVVELDAIWGQHIWDWRDQLLAAEGPFSKFKVFEQLLAQKLAETAEEPRRRAAVNWALGQFLRDPHYNNVAAVANALGISHKHFIDQFRRETGLAPKIFCRIRRFQEVLERIQSRKTVDWADIACGCGYYDQAHFVNDFVAFAGINPSAYLRHRIDGDPKFVRAI